MDSPRHAAFTMLTFEEYAQRLATAFGLAVVSPPSDAGLYDDLGLDSLQAFQLMLFTEGLAGASFPPDFPPPLFTVADAYSYYELLSTEPK